MKKVRDKAPPNADLGLRIIVKPKEEKSCGCPCGCGDKNGGGDPPAKPSERISGSDRNPEGSASGSRGGIEISEATEEALRSKVEEHNAEHGDRKGRKVDLGMLKAVYRRGAGAFSTSHRTGVGREQWAIARVNAFLYLVRNGKPEDADYTTDYDLLPDGHPKKTDAKSEIDLESIRAAWSLELDSMDIESKNCGVGPEGFEEGNTCGSGGGSGGSSESSGSKPKKPRSGKPPKGQAPADGIDPPKTHSVAIPPNPRKISIDQTEAALRSMGYTMTEWKPSVSGTTVTIRDPSGRTAKLPSSDVVNMIYANSTDPKANDAPAIKPRKRLSGSVVSQKALFSIDAPAPRQIVTKSAEEEFEEITDGERRLAENLAGELRARMREVLAEIRRNPVPTQEMVAKLEQIVRRSKFDRRVVEAVRPYLLEAVESGKKIGIDTVSTLMSPTANPEALFRTGNESLAAYAQVEADKAARRMADSFREYTEAKVRSIVAEAMSEGRSIPEIADALEDWSDETETDIADSRHRAITIARTEAQRAARKTEVAAWKASGVVVGKTWLLAPDPCEFCEAASDLFSKSEAAIGLDSAFFEKGSVLEGADGGNLSLDYEAIDGPPLHPNCRCSLQPKLSDDYEDLILEAEDEVRRLGPFNPENA